MEEEKNEQTIADSQSAEIVEYKKKRKDVIVELSLFLILGILLGVTIKTEAVKKITIGFNDYKLANARQAYNITMMQKELQTQAAQESASARNDASPTRDGQAAQQQPAQGVPQQSTQAPSDQSSSVPQQQ
jgi:hypothetical protein